MRNQSLTLMLFAALAMLPLRAVAAPITVAQMDAGHVLIDFDELAEGTIVDNEYAALGVTISGTVGANGTGAATDVIAAQWDPIYIGTGASVNWNGSVIFTFSTFVDQVGMNIVDSFDNWLSVYGAGGVLLETVNAAGTVGEEFLGIDTNGVPIAYAIASGTFFAVDDVRFNAARVPEPGTFLLLGTAAAFLARRARRQRES